MKKILTLTALLTAIIIATGMSFIGYNSYKLDATPSGNPPSGFIHQWPTLDGSNNLVLNYRLSDGTDKTFTAGGGAVTQALYMYTQDVTLNQALDGCIVSNYGATSDIKMTLAAGLSDGFGVRVVNEAGFITKQSPSAVISSGFYVAGTQLTYLTNGSVGYTEAGALNYTENASGDYLGFQFAAPVTLHRIRFYNYATSARIKDFKIERYNGGSWVKVPITGVESGTGIINTDEARYSAYGSANGWAGVTFTHVTDTQFRITTVALSVANNAAVTEIEMYSGPYLITLSPPSGGQLPLTSAVDRNLVSLAKGDSLKIDKTANNFTGESVFPAVANWVDTAQ